MEVTISVPKEIESILAEKAAAQGQDIKAFIENMIKTQTLRPSLEKLLAPVRKDFEESGMIGDE